MTKISDTEHEVFIESSFTKSSFTKSSFTKSSPIKIDTNENSMNHKQVSDTTYPTHSIEWLSRLINFDTVSRQSNLALIRYVENYCKQLGLTPVLTFNKEQSKANLFVTVPAGSQGEITSGGIILSGHSDVVPVEGQDWTNDPFTATISNGKLYGRGACDMKGFIACALRLLPEAVQLSQAGKLQKPLHFAITFDEEIGCLGMPFLLADIAKRGIRPDYCIVGEPSMMRMVVAHKGVNVYKCSVQGKSAHSSLTPKGVNAISYAARLITFIDDLANELACNHDKYPQDSLFDVPFSTLSIAQINGGTANNIVPNLCEFYFDYRNLPLMEIETVLAPIEDKIAQLNKQMQAVDSNTGITLEQLESVPAMTDTDSEALQTLIAGLVDDSTRHKVAYATEGGEYTNANIPTIICGPGSIEQAHKADEFVSLEQIAECDEFLTRLLDSLTD